MIVRCPQCKTEIRVAADAPAGKVVPYMCPGCQSIVRIDLELDEVSSTSSSGSFRKLKRRRTILVADDSEEILRACEEVLSAEGYHVLGAHDGAEAIRMIREEHPDLVVLDLLMPRVTGFDVLREIRQDERVKDTLVLAISSVYKDNILEFLHQLGAHGFLEKNQLAESLAFRVASLFGTAEP